LDWRFGVFLEVELIAVDGENVLDECQVGPAMVYHRVQVIKSVKEDKQCAVLLLFAFVLAL